MVSHRGYTKISNTSGGAMKVAAYTQGLLTPAARFRVRQYISVWRDFGIDTNEIIGNAYPPDKLVKRPLWLGVEVGRRCWQLIENRRADLTLFQRQFVSTILTLETFTQHPRVLDVDDAIWLNQRFNSVDRLATQCDLVVCGNAWLADHFSRFNHRIEIVPTAVDTSVFMPRVPIAQREHLVIGWVGTSGNLIYLQSIQNALRVVLREIPDARLLVVSNMPPSLPLLPPDQLIFQRWSEALEIDTFQNIDIGIMPLIDSEWARGKCSYKLLQYMACGIASIVSPVGMNVTVAASGGVLLANTESEWVDALLTLIRNPHLRLQYGAAGRANVECNYAVTTVGKRLADLFMGFT